MKSITTQKQLDQLKEIKAGEEYSIDAELKLNGIIKVYGKLVINKKIDCDYYNDRNFEAWENSSVIARGNSSVEAWGNSSVEAWGNSSVEAWENSSVEAWENSSVKAWENSSVVARGNSVVRLFSIVEKVVLYGYSVLIKDVSIKMKIIKKSETCIVNNTKQEPYLKREGIDVKKSKVILYKRVSEDYKTQEDTENETIWTIGKTLTHQNWNPIENECGEGKFHACSRPYFCDEFRNNKNDKYIAIEINVKDLYEWKKPSYPHKIAFRKGKVLYECNKKGERI